MLHLDQNQALDDHLLVLQEVETAMLQVPPRDSIARPPPSVPRTPASAGLRLNRGREDEQSSPEPRARTARGPPPSAHDFENRMCRLELSRT